MQKEQNNNDPYYEGPLIQINGPNYNEGQWTVDITIGPKHQTIHGKTEEEIHEQTEQLISQQIAELEKSRSRLREILNRPKRNPWPDLQQT